MDTPDIKLRDALNALGVVEVVSHEFIDGVNQVKLLFRVTSDQKVILSVIDAILVEEERLAEESPWNVHICKHYMRRSGKLVYGWNFTVQINSDDVGAAVGDICRLLAIMSKHVEVLRRHSELNRAVGNRHRNSERVPVSRKPGQVPGVGLGGVVHNGEVVEMPLIGVTEHRNEPQSPMVGTPTRGQVAGGSSKGAHRLIR